MRSAIVENNNLKIVDLPEPKPRENELLIKSLVCGICGSDLHCRHHTHELADSSREVVGSAIIDADRPILMGHEFVGEVLETRQGSTFKAGDQVVSLPFLMREEGLAMIGFSSADVPGGFSEQMLVDSRLTMKVPNGLSPDMAALTEPMAVALHAVNRGEPTRNHVPLVIGCGPIGLAVIAVLKMMKIGPIVASDFSRARRDLARKMGADVVVNPAEHSPYDSWKEAAQTANPEEAGPISPLFGGADLRPSLIFECVGVPGLIQNVCAGAPYGARVVVVGLCMEKDTIMPSYPVMKEIDLRFVSFYSGEEFGATLNHLANGELDAGGLISDTVGLSDIESAFDRLGKPENDVKILVKPSE
ncbi:zinc-binding dehydrogenase [Marinobacter sp. M216]|uniref:Zinc-binding dehydrogenase n=1 Tax=Marinobacter albus TaxID=3030833 RepID=A0ABT7HFF6_9GAMM|nr:MULTISPECIES: zinc-binding dehydrogenase [unclassified Marinobacter]MBW7472169.1 zinc-binding dehydrogenase [Marinobacter sp. F4218]MDK9558739.1 zinc-binding dehydrogenase [Marinobacter sp. M216]